MIARFTTFAARLLEAGNLRQLAALALALLLALGLRWYLGRRLAHAGSRPELPPQPEAPSWLERARRTLLGSLLPFLLWLLVWAAATLFSRLSWPQGGLRWLLPLLAFWLLYRLVAAFFAARLPPGQSQVWRRQLLRPILALATALYLAGFLDEVLGFGIQWHGQGITVRTLLLGLAVLLLFVLAAQGFRHYLSRSLLPGAGFEPALTQAISAIVAYLIIVTGFFTALSLVGIDLTTFAVIAGGLSVGIGFGLQAIITNFLSGFILLVERSVGPGDVVQVGETVGQVMDVGIRSTRVRSRDNVDLVVPNSNFLTQVVTNFTRGTPDVRIRVAVGVSYDARPREVEEALLEAASKVPALLPQPAPSVTFSDFGDSSLLFHLLAWTNDPIHIPKLSSDLRYAIWEALGARQIEIPFPQRDIHIRSMPAGQA